MTMTFTDEELVNSFEKHHATVIIIIILFVCVLSGSDQDLWRLSKFAFFPSFLVVCHAIEPETSSRYIDATWRFPHFSNKKNIAKSFKFIKILSTEKERKI